MGWRKRINHPYKSMQVINFYVARRTSVNGSQYMIDFKNPHWFARTIFCSDYRGCTTFELISQSNLQI